MTCSELILLAQAHGAQHTPASWRNPHSLPGKPGSVTMTEAQLLAFAQAGIAADRAQRQAEPGDYDTWMKNPYTLVLNKSIAEDYVPRHVQECQAGKEPVAWQDRAGKPHLRYRYAVLDFEREPVPLFAAPQPAA